jgi:hypothetical protein
MAGTPPLSLGNLISISVTVAAAAATSNPFNQGLFIGPSTVIPTNARLRQYTSTSAMLSDGFTTTDPEYLAAEIYFSQATAAQYIWIGRQDLTASETLLQAAQACRDASATWYGLAVYNPTDADNLALAEWADPLWQTTRYYAWSGSTAIPAGTAGNIALQLQTLKLRVVGIYATTQSGLYPNNIYAAAGIMGVEMGLNTGLASSFFTLAHKSITGIAAESLTQTQYSHIIAAGFNVYGFFGGAYEVVETGFLSNGSPSFLWLNLAMLVANLQTNIMNILASSPAVPQTNAGEQLLIGGANKACAIAASIGFLASGTWTSTAVLNLANGDAVPNGYLNQAQAYSAQLSGDRAAGKAMPIYCCITTAGAVQSLVIGVYTQL